MFAKQLRAYSRKFIWLLPIALLTGGYGLAAVVDRLIQSPLLPGTPYIKGEYVDYRVHYGWITAGEATMRVKSDLYKLNEKVCWGMEVNGKTVGAFDRVLRIRDIWGSYVDTNSNLPMKSYRTIEEGNYRRYEETYFDYKTMKARMEVVNDPKKEFIFSSGIQDIVSGYYYLRQIDYNQLKNGDIITVNGIIEDKTYPLKVRYLGKERIGTKFGKVSCISLSPIVPDNRLFDGENSIKFYISDDLNRIPLKIRAELFVGAVELDIKGYGNLRYPTILGN